MITITKTRLAPKPCRHCNQIPTRPPGFLRVLEVLSPGTGHSNQAEGVLIGQTIAAITKHAGISRQLVDVSIKLCIKHGLVEQVPGVIGVNIYRKTKYGQVLLSKWKQYGWKPPKNCTQPEPMRAK